MERRVIVDAFRTLGCLPSLKPYAQYLPDPFFSKGIAAVQKLAGIAVARVRDRLAIVGSVDRKDLLARLMEGRDEHGNPMGQEELTAEALTQMIAGSDTTSNSMCAMLFHVLNNRHVIPKLQKELDARLPKTGVPRFNEVKDLP